MKENNNRRISTLDIMAYDVLDTISRHAIADIETGEIRPLKADEVGEVLERAEEIYMARVIGEPVPSIPDVCESDGGDIHGKEN